MGLPRSVRQKLTHCVVIFERNFVISGLNSLGDVLPINALVSGKVTENNFAIRRFFVCLSIEFSIQGFLSWLQLGVWLIAV
jgi:hypothetical protein